MDIKDVSLTIDDADGDLTQLLHKLTKYPEAYSSLKHAVLQLQRGIYTREVAEHARHALDRLAIDVLKTEKGIESMDKSERKRVIQSFFDSKGTSEGYREFFLGLLTVHSQFRKNGDQYGEQAEVIFIFSTAVKLMALLLNVSETEEAS